MNTPTSYTRKNRTSRVNTLYERQPATLNRSLSIIRGVYWVAIATIFTLVLSMQEAQGKPFLNLMAAHEIVQSGVRVISEPSTLLLNVSHFNKENTSIQKIKQALTSPKIITLNGTPGAVTLSEHSELHEIKKEHHLHAVSIKNLEQMGQHMQAYTNKPSKKTLFDIMFGSNPEVEATEVSYDPVLTAAEKDNKPEGSPLF